MLPPPAHPHPAPTSGAGAAAPTRRQPPVWRLAALALAVLGLHALVLQGLPTGVGEGWGGGVRPITTLRLGGAPGAQADAAIPTNPPATTPAAPGEAPAQAQAAAAGTTVASAAPASAPASAPAPALPPAVAEAAPPEPPAAATSAPVLASAAETPASAALAGADGSAGAPEATTGGQAPPVYATRPPPSVQMAFDLRRGLLQGDAEFAWQNDGRRYELTMTGTAFSLTLLNWRSSGAFDGAGLAPERFLDSRRSRDQRAANFQRAAGKITFSGPPVEYPLLPGAQDRLSWLVQLAAIVNADPAAFPVGSRISFFVAGSRGEGDIWHFNVLGREDLSLPAGAVRGALHLQREPRRAYDTGGEVWLDPARHHLPVRVRLTVAQTDERTEFLLRSLRGL